jgi:glycosyltransferase involved in cell wall biosynthesis
MPEHPLAIVVTEVERPHAGLRVAIVTSIHPEFDARIWRYAKLTRTFAETHLVCPWNRPNGGLVEGIRLHTFRPATSMRTRYRSTSGVLRRLLPILPGVDIVHFHDPDLLPMMMALAPFRHVVYDVHENYADEMLIRPWVPEQLRRFLHKSVVGAHWLASRTIGNIVCVVPDQEEQFRGAKRLMQIRNFASAERALEAADDYLSRQPSVISTASQYPANGTWVLLDIAERLMNSAPNVSVLVVDRFINESFRNEVMQSIERRSLSNVHLLPNVEPTRIMEQLNRATIGISTALNVPKNYKALPTKVFEYMAAGIPIVASAHPHIIPVVDGGRCGFCCDPDNPESFVNAIVRLTEDAYMARAMGVAGKSAFLERYTWESQREALLSFYGQIVKSRRRKHARERASAELEG